MTDARDQLPTDGAAPDDEWVAWGHGSTKTRTKGHRHHHKHRSSSSSSSSRTHSSSGKRKHHHHHHHRHKVRNRIIAVLVIVVVVALLGCTAAFAYSAYGVAQEAQAMMGEVGNLQDELVTGDAEAMQASASVIEESAASMAGTVEGPLWQAASALPGIGTDVSNVRALIAAVQDLSANAITPLAGSAGDFDLSKLMDDGRIDVATIAQLADVIIEAAPAVQRTCTTIDEMEDGSIAQVNDIIDSAGEQLSTLNSLCGGLSELAPYLEDMLGANGTRTYLIAAHNTSELKCSGGFIGSVGTLVVDDGELELGEFGTFNDCNRDLEETGDRSNRAESVTAEEAALFTWTYGIHAGDSGVNPDFTREGELVKEMWEYVHTEDQIDGVIALDSQVLANFLAYTGSITTKNGAIIDGDNCVEYLGYELYWEYFNKNDYTEDAADKVDERFAEVAALAFDKVVDNIGSVGIMGLADALGTSADEDRLLVWMDDEDEEQAMVNLDVDGAVNTDPTVPELGIFFESRRASKLDWWSTSNTTYGKVSTNSDGSTTYSVTTTITNSITEEEVEMAAQYILGSTLNGKNKYDVYLYAPAGGTISNVDASHQDGKVRHYTIDGNQVAKVTVKIPAEGVTTITYLVTTSAEAEGELQIRQTPMAQDSSTTVSSSTSSLASTEAAKEE